jgi:hypothetical protein
VVLQFPAVETAEGCGARRRGDGVAGGVVHDDLVATVAFGLVEGSVRSADERGEVFFVLGVDDPEADCELRKPGDGDGGGEPDSRRVEDVATVGGVAARQRDDELLTAVAAHEILGAPVS